MKHPIRRWLTAIAVLVPAACGPTIAGYSLEAYKNATTLKADVIALVDDSTEPYASHAADIRALTVRLNEAAEFSRGEANNQLSTTQWDILIGPDGKLYAAFLKSWQSHGQLNQIESANWKAKLETGFNEIICLEANKQSATACPPPATVAPGA